MLQQSGRTSIAVLAPGADKPRTIVESTSQLNLVQNWFDDLKARVPRKS